MAGTTDTSPDHKISGRAENRDRPQPHAFLAVLASQEREKGALSGTHPTSWTSHRPRFDVCWQLDPAAVLRNATTR
jgi:hypothetical protein